MPLYEYQCDQCGNVEVMQKVSDTPLTSCPNCQSKNFQKGISASAFHLKGGGWYKTDYSSSSSSTISTNTESNKKDSLKVADSGKKCGGSCSCH